MVALTDLVERLQAEDPEERQTISGVSWSGYETLLQDLGDRSRYRMIYLDGMLELMSPSRRHESRKSARGVFVGGSRL